MSEGLRVERDGAVTTVVLDRPERLNALSYEVIRGLTRTLEELRGDPTQRVVLLTGAGRPFARRDLSGLRVAKVGGAPGARASPAALRRARGRAGQRLRLTEGSGLNLQLQAHESLRRLGSVGIPLLGQEAKVVNASGGAADPGEPGELLLACSTVMKEYWRNPAATAAALRDGWLHTGDVASVDADGYFRIVDRAKDMIISGGINIYPAEIEAVLSRHPDVAEVAVVGVPDERWGEAPVACVVTGNRSLSLEQLNAFAEGSLAHFKRPRELVLRDAPLPRSMSGKVLEREIRSDLMKHR